ncbi:hypothetical protein ABZN20_14325 [Methylococcus sp. ANG]
MDGVPLVEVRDVLRHSTVKMTERYAHLHPENVRAVVGELEVCHVLVTSKSEDIATNRPKMPQALDYGMKGGAPDTIRTYDLPLRRGTKRKSNNYQQHNKVIITTSCDD